MATPTSLPASFVTGNVLTAAEMNNLRGAFRILQVVGVSYATATQNNTSTYADTGLTASITPSSTSSKILVYVSQNGCVKTFNNLSNHLLLKLVRGSTDIAQIDTGGGYTGTALDNYFGSVSTFYLDSPATTSATTYKTQFRNNFNGTGVIVQANSSVSTMVLLEVSA